MLTDTMVEIVRVTEDCRVPRISDEEHFVVNLIILNKTQRPTFTESLSVLCDLDIHDNYPHLDHPCDHGKEEH